MYEESSKAKTDADIEYKRIRDIRMKDWKDCSVEEKTEKLKMAHEELSHMRYSLNNVLDRIVRLENHSHLNDKMVVPFENPKGLNSLGVSVTGQVTKHVLS